MYKLNYKVYYLYVMQTQIARTFWRMQLITCGQVLLRNNPISGETMEPMALRGT